MMFTSCHLQGSLISTTSRLALVNAVTYLGIHKIIEFLYKLVTMCFLNIIFHYSIG